MKIKTPIYDMPDLAIMVQYIEKTVAEVTGEQAFKWCTNRDHISWTIKFEGASRTLCYLRAENAEYRFSAGTGGNISLHDHGEIEAALRAKVEKLKTKPYKPSSNRRGLIFGEEVGATPPRPSRAQSLGAWRWKTRMDVTAE